MSVKWPQSQEKILSWRKYPRKQIETLVLESDLLPEKPTTSDAFVITRSKTHITYAALSHDVIRPEMWVCEATPVASVTGDAKFFGGSKPAPHETFSNYFVVQHVDITPEEEILHGTFVQSNVPASIQGGITRRIVQRYH